VPDSVEGHLVAQPADFAAQLRPLQGAFHNEQQPVFVDRLAQVVVSAEFHGFHGELNVLHPPPR